jgi:threonine dehydratase
MSGRPCGARLGRALSREGAALGGSAAGDTRLCGSRPWCTGPRCARRCSRRLGANVLEVSHERLAPSLPVDEVEVVLQVETRGPEHCTDVKAKLRADGYILHFSYDRPALSCVVHTATVWSLR